MRMPVGGSLRAAPALAAALLLAGLLAGCSAPESDATETVTPDPGHGVVTIWMSRPKNADHEGVTQLVAVPRFVSFHAADENTTERLNDTAGFVALSTGWSARPAGWGPDEWPAGAEKDWLQPYEVWFQDQVPVGTYDMVRIEFLDAHLVAGRAQPDVHIGTTNPTSGTPRLTFYAAEGSAFEVVEGEELVLHFETELRPEGRRDFIIQ